MKKRRSGNWLSPPWPSEWPAAAVAQETLLNVSYDPTRELYQEVNAQFAPQWKAKSGRTVDGPAVPRRARASRRVRSSTVSTPTW